MRVTGTQPGIILGRAAFLKQGHFDIHLIYDLQKKGSAGKYFVVFSPRYKGTFLNQISNNNLTLRGTQTEQFVDRAFFLFSKKTGQTSPLPPASCAPKLIYFLKRGQYSTNFFFRTMSKFSKTSLLVLKSTALHGQQLPYWFN